MCIVLSSIQCCMQNEKYENLSSSVRVHGNKEMPLVTKTRKPAHLGDSTAF